LAGGLVKNQKRGEIRRKMVLDAMVEAADSQSKKSLDRKEKVRVTTILRILTEEPVLLRRQGGNHLKSGQDLLNSHLR